MIDKDRYIAQSLFYQCIWLLHYYMMETEDKGSILMGTIDKDGMSICGCAFDALIRM